ncbi:hypothetical protein GCM10023107_92310 [Actinoplanes octamycinicus]|nr:hypothetical protein Aoc01nite_39650 [Actinoplanes octamycinicus]
MARDRRSHVTEAWPARRSTGGTINPSVVDDFATKNATKWALMSQQNTAATSPTERANGSDHRRTGERRVAR